MVACGAVLLQHSILWTAPAGVVAAWAFVMLLHFSRTAFFFLTALVLTYSQITRPRSTLGFWRRRYVQLGVPYLVWTGIYWIYTLLSTPGSSEHAGSLLWQDLVYGYYQLYFAVVLFQLYLVFPLLLRLIRSSRHHIVVMAVSGTFALVLAADLHYPGSFGPIGDATVWLSTYWPWARDPLTYQEQFVAGILVALHLDQVRQLRRALVPAGHCRGLRRVDRGHAVVPGGGLDGSTTGRASDLYQPIAFLWFTAAVAALECGTYMWYQRTVHGHPPRVRALSGRLLGQPHRWHLLLPRALSLTLLRSALDASGLASHLGWAGNVAVLYAATVVVSAALLRPDPRHAAAVGPRRAGAGRATRPAPSPHQSSCRRATAPSLTTRTVPSEFIPSTFPATNPSGGAFC